MLLKLSNQEQKTCHGACVHCQEMPSEEGSLHCNEWNKGVHLLANVIPEGNQVCLTRHRSLSAFLNRGVLEKFFLLPKINWKTQPKPSGPNG